MNGFILCRKADVDEDDDNDKNENVPREIDGEPIISEQQQKYQKKITIVERFYYLFVQFLHKMFISLAFNALPPVSCCNSGLTCILHIDDATFADGRSAPCIYFRSINIYGRTKWNVLRGYGTEGTEE